MTNKSHAATSTKYLPKLIPSIGKGKKKPYSHSNTRAVSTVPVSIYHNHNPFPAARHSCQFLACIRGSESANIDIVKADPSRVSLALPYLAAVQYDLGTRRNGQPIAVATPFTPCGNLGQGKRSIRTSPASG